mgnify:CR=1 FL=1
MKTIAYASAVAAGSLLFVGVGVAGADSVQVEGNYSTLAACQADGPHVQITTDNDAYDHWNCQQGDDGLYYLFLAEIADAEGMKKLPTYEIKPTGNVPVFARFYREMEKAKIGRAHV